jgi:ORF6N domain
MATGAGTTVDIGSIERLVLIVRGQRVLLDVDLARLYGVETRVLNQAVRRNRDRFPQDFMFQLDLEEARLLRSQTVIFAESSGSSKAMDSPPRSKYRPLVFTEHGVAMLSSVLRSKRAILVNIEIMRTFVRLRRMLAGNAELARKLAALERKYDDQFKVVFTAIRELMTPPNPPRKRRIGFEPWE